MTQSDNPLLTSDFDYDLPIESIAQQPVEPRDSARLLVMDRHSGELAHAVFRDLGRFLRPGDLLVANETRVLPARLRGIKADSGGKVELLLLKKRTPTSWEAMAGGKGLRVGRRLSFSTGLEADIAEVLTGSQRLVQFDQPVESHLEQIGEMPVPPYIHPRLEDPERYQTVFAETSGSAAAPTAGLHFTADLLALLEKSGVRMATVTLHIGLDTFAPVRSERAGDHPIHAEWCSLPAATAAAINETRAAGGRIICVGTTSVRTVESAANQVQHGQPISAFEGDTQLFILPGYTYRFVDGLITNFHLPKSSLLMLVSALAGREAIQSAYRTAIARGYRFYSFGDAMLILKDVLRNVED